MMNNVIQLYTYRCIDMVIGGYIGKTYVYIYIYKYIIYVII